MIINHGTLGPVGSIADADLEAWKSGYDVNFLSAVAFVSMINCFLGKKYENANNFYFSV